MTKCVIYAAKSTEDKRGSIPSQIEDCRGMADREDWHVLDVFHDEGFSAYTGNRGPDLEAAKRLAVEEATAQEPVMLLVQHSDRLARGAGDAPGAADHLGEVYFWARRHNVRLRSVQDDSNLEDAIRAVLIGERNTEDSRRKSEAVSSGKDRQFKSGERLGGPVNDGLVLKVERDAADRIVSRQYLRDPERAVVVDRIFDLAEEGHGDPTIARMLNAEGYRTREYIVKSGPHKGEKKGGKPWTRRTVQHTILNPIYAGRITRKSRGARKHNKKLDKPEVVEATNVEWLIDPDRYDRIIADRDKRDRRKGSKGKRGGRSTTNYALARLAVCDRCGSRMYAATSTYTRKSDGKRARHYVCAHVRTDTGLCDQPPLDAERVDAAVVKYLDELFIDVDAWQAELAKARDGQRATAEAALDRCAKEAQRLDRLAAKVRADYLKQLEAGKEGAAEVAAETLADLKRQTDALAAEAKVHQSVIDEMEKPADDSILDAYNALVDAVRDGGDNVAELNEKLRAKVEEFRLDQVDPETVAILPVLKAQDPPDVAAAFDEWRDAGEPDPTPEEIEEWERITNVPSILGPEGGDATTVLPPRAPALIWATSREKIRPPAKRLEIPLPEMGQDSHEYRWTKPKRLALAASQP